MASKTNTAKAGWAALLVAALLIAWRAGGDGSIPTPTTTTTVQSTTTTAAPSLPCGDRLNKSDGSVWQCTFADEFDGTSLDLFKWYVQETATSNFSQAGACNVNSPNNIEVKDGTLRLTARKEAAPFQCGKFMTEYTVATVSTFTKFSQAYGRFEVRAKFPDVKVAGLQEALWLYPENPVKYGPWPYSGEIDIAEVYHKYPDRAIPFIHYVAAAPDPRATNNYCLIDNISEFHTYTAIWTPESIEILYDGKRCLINTWSPAAPLVKPQPFDHPYIIALTQALGIGVNAFDAGKTPLPATSQIDYVRVWK